MAFVSLSLLGLGPFTLPTLLWWGVAAAAPVIIHLWNRRQYNEVDWAAMEFLIAAMRKNSRRIRIEQLLLLIIRTLILLLFAAALANPIINGLSTLGSSLGMRGHTHFVLVLDGSYSMELKGESGETRFEVTQRLATELVENASQGDGFTIVMMSDPPQVVIGEPAYEPRDVVEELTSLRPRHAGALLTPTLAEIEKIVSRASSDHPRLSECRVLFMSDLAENTWKDIDTPDARERVGRLSDKATLVMIDVGSSVTSNMAVTHLSKDESLVTTEQSIEFTASVENLGKQPQSSTLEFFIDGQRTQRTTVQVPAGESKSVQYQHQFESTGEYLVEARLGDDSLAVDNHRWLSVPVRNAIRVLCVGGKRGSARNVALALDPSSGRRSRVMAEVKRESSLLEDDLHQHDCIFICNVGRLGRDEAKLLYDYVHGGGGLALFLGDQVQPDSYNDSLADATSEQLLLPCTLGDTVAGEFLLQTGTRHPINEAFASVPGSGLFTIPSYRYIRLTPRDDDKVRRVFNFNNGDAAMLEGQVGDGRCFVFATAASTSSLDTDVSPAMPWTALSTVKDFVSLVQEMLPLLIRGREAGRNVEVGDPLEMVVPGIVSNVAVALKTPNGQDERVRMEVDGEESRWQFDQTWTSGGYTATYDTSLDRTDTFAVNINTRESDLARFDRDLLPSQFETDIVAEDSDTAELPTSKSLPFFRYLLGAVFALLLVESALAWRFGDSSGAS